MFVLKLRFSADEHISCTGSEPLFGRRFIPGQTLSLLYCCRPSGSTHVFSALVLYAAHARCGDMKAKCAVKHNQKQNRSCWTLLFYFFTYMVIRFFYWSNPILFSSFYDFILLMVFYFQYFPTIIGDWYQITKWIRCQIKAD